MENICKSKRWYESKRNAKTAIRKFRSIGLSKKSEPYRCPCCGFWHITTKTDMGYKVRTRLL